MAFITKRLVLLVALAVGLAPRTISAFVGLSTRHSQAIRLPGWSTRRNQYYRIKSLNPLQAKPYVEGDPLPLGSLVGYNLDVPFEFLHLGIHAGPGNSYLKEMTGQSDLDPDKHYVIEYSGPTRFSGMPQSKPAGRLVKGKGGQNIWITPMRPSTDWYVLEIDSSHYGAPYSGQETIERALSHLDSSFGGYDVISNNCRHFAVWARYGVKSMCLGDEGKQVVGRHLGGMAAFAFFGAIGAPALVIGTWALCGLNILTARTGGQLCRRISFID